MANKSHDYTQQLYLKHHETGAIIDNNTGEVKPVSKKGNNIPDGKFVLKDYNFTKLNCDMIERLVASDILSNEEIGIITYMASIAKFNNNSLEPLSDSTMLKELSVRFRIGINRVGKVFNRLYKLGVYAQLKIYTTKEEQYWVLNPYISWKGKFADDSIFSHFANSPITKLLSK